MEVPNTNVPAASPFVFKETGKETQTDQGVKYSGTVQMGAHSIHVTVMVSKDQLARLNANGKLTDLVQKTALKTAQAFILAEAHDSNVEKLTLKGEEARVETKSGSHKIMELKDLANSALKSEQIQQSKTAQLTQRCAYEILGKPFVPASELPAKSAPASPPVPKPEEKTPVSVPSVHQQLDNSGEYNLDDVIFSEASHNKGQESPISESDNPKRTKTPPPEEDTKKFTSEEVYAKKAPPPPPRDDSPINQPEKEASSSSESRSAEIQNPPRPPSRDVPPTPPKRDIPVMQSSGNTVSNQEEERDISQEEPEPIDISEEESASGESYSTLEEEKELEIPKPPSRPPPPPPQPKLAPEIPKQTRQTTEQSTPNAASAEPDVQSDAEARKNVSQPPSPPPPPPPRESKLSSPNEEPSVITPDLKDQIAKGVKLRKVVPQPENVKSSEKNENTLADALGKALNERRNVIKGKDEEDNDEDEVWDVDSNKA